VLRYDDGNVGCFPHTLIGSIPRGLRRSVVSPTTGGLCLFDGTWRTGL